MNVRRMKIGKVLACHNVFRFHVGERHLFAWVRLKLRNSTIRQEGLRHNLTWILTIITAFISMLTGVRTLTLQSSIHPSHGMPLPRLSQQDTILATSLQRCKATRSRFTRWEPLWIRHPVSNSKSNDNLCSRSFKSGAKLSRVPTWSTHDPCTTCWIFCSYISEFQGATESTSPTI